MMAILRAAREATGVSQRALSIRMRRKHSYINLVENGQRLPNLCEFVEIAQAIGADPALLVGRIIELTRVSGAKHKHASGEPSLGLRRIDTAKNTEASTATLMLGVKK